MRPVHFVSLGGCLLAVGCSVYDASLLAGADESNAAGPSSAGAGGGGQGGDVGAGGPGGGLNVTANSGSLALQLAEIQLFGF